ncbi:hypothetical protein DXA68_04140 [Bacteroides stercorirosoris]|uniref:Uncharacterized protein n=1 Tax=Bacteroides stercorirosoris TaxID=871324 RepID=A0A413H9S2_9BACE|nr:hypothetical protein DXA68_04140 [Bacteroides stercorirosoris]
MYWHRNDCNDSLNCHFPATVLARLCHAYGKVVPMRWQSCANAMAKPCQCDGKSWPMRWQDIGTVIAIIP